MMTKSKIVLCGFIATMLQATSLSVFADQQAVSLKAGWNLISSDLLVEESELKSYVEDNGISIVWGQEWDATAGSYGWKKQTGKFGSNLKQLQSGAAYWVKADADKATTLAGEKGDGVSVLNLKQGWNFVGKVGDDPATFLTNAVEEGRKISIVWGQEWDEASSSYGWKKQTGKFGSNLKAYSSNAGYWMYVEKAPAAYSGMASAEDAGSAHGKINVQGAPTGKIVEVYVDSLQDEAMSNDPLGTGAIPNDIKVPAFPAVAYLDTDGSGTVETAVVADSAYSGKKLYMTVSSWDSTAKEYTQKCAKIESLGLALSTADEALTAAACPGS
jgi:uncharacterized protein YndB with AHSA1/START domain